MDRYKVQGPIFGRGGWHHSPGIDSGQTPRAAAAASKRLHANMSFVIATRLSVFSWIVCLHPLMIAAEITR